MIELKIDPEFRDKIPPLTDAEFEQLKENILSDGEVYEPICVWDETIVDGHNRWRIIQEHPDIPYRVKEMNFADKWAAFDWMYKKQLGRRNLTDEQRTVLIGKMYEARKKSAGAPKGNTNASKQCAQNEHVEKPKRISEQIAQEIGVGTETVKRAEKFSKGIDALSEVSREAVDKILAGGSGVNKKDVMELPQMEPEERKEFADAVIAGDKPKAKPRGFTKEEREKKSLVNKVISEMYSPELQPFTVEMLEEDIEINGQNYIDMLHSTLIEREILLTDDNKPKIAKKIDNIINEIQKIRRLVE